MKFKLNMIDTWLKFLYQRVERPPQRITVSTRTGILWNQWYMRPQGRSSQVACAAIINSLSLCGRLEGFLHCLQRLFMSSAQIFSMRLRSSELAGQGSLWIPCCWWYKQEILEVWHGALSSVASNDSTDEIRLRSGSRYGPRASSQYCLEFKPNRSLSCVLSAEVHFRIVTKGEWYPYPTAPQNITDVRALLNDGAMNLSSFSVFYQSVGPCMGMCCI